MIVAVDDADGRWELLLARRQPDRHEQPAVVQLDAVARPGRLDDEFVLGGKRCEGLRDLDGRRERPRVVCAAAIKVSRNRSSTGDGPRLSLRVDDQDAVIDRRLAGVDQDFRYAPCFPPSVLCRRTVS